MKNKNENRLTFVWALLTSACLGWMKFWRRHASNSGYRRGVISELRNSSLRVARILRTFRPQLVRISRTTVTITLLLNLLLVSSVLAQGALSQEVQNNDQVTEGALVSLTGSDPTRVTLAEPSNGDSLFGVVTTTGKSLAELGTEVQDGTLIAITGDVSVVVSTINGDISSGDVLGVSRIKGVAAKVSTSEGATTIGVALSDFSSSSVTSRDVSTTTDEGAEGTVTIGTIKVRLAINDFYIDNVAKSSVLLGFGESFVGKPVSQSQIVAAAAIAVASILTGGVMMWFAVRGGFVSIGRNPLSGNAVFNGLFYVTLLSVAIIIGGLVVGYIVLLL